MQCHELRDLLLDHVYGALDDAESAAADAHLAACEACRAAMAQARAQRDVLAEAALAEAGDVRFVPPKPKLIPRSWWISAAAVLVAGTAVAAVDATLAGGRAASLTPVYTIRGPSVVSRTLPAEFHVATGRFGGEGLPRRWIATISDGPRGEVQVGSADAGPDGATIPLDLSRLAPGAETRVYFKAGEGSATPAFVASVGVRETTRLLSRVSTDKPLYRPGETLRVRGVALESLRLTPAGNSDLHVKLLDPRGAAVAESDLPSLSGVTAWEHKLPDDAPGGTWKVVFSGTKGAGEALVAASEQEFRVRSYRVPRLKFRWEFDRVSYRPGDRGNAMLVVERAEGGVPAGAAVETRLKAREDELFEESDTTVARDGSVLVPFEVPDDDGIANVRLTVTVKDGGAVEGITRTVPLVLDSVRFETFPEGGALVAGLPNRVYFRATTPSGDPADVAAELRDAAGAKVVDVVPDVRGMGAFEFTPREGATYTVTATGGDLALSADLLEAQPDGATLRALDEEVAAKGAVRVRVGSMAGGKHTVQAWCRGTLLGETTIDVPARSTAEASVRLRSDVGGVLRVTVLDEGLSPVAERLVARAAARRLDVTVTPSKAKFAPRERVSVAVRARDESGVASQAILGAAVADAGVVALADDRATAPMPFHFLVGMEVERLEDVATFASGPGAARAVDRLLGVQGWRRFAWRDPAAFAAQHPEAGPRVAPVGASDVPTVWTNEDSVRSDVESARDRSLERSTGIAVLAGALGLFVGGIVVGVRGLVQGRKLAATGAFAVPALLLVGVVTLVVSVKAQEKFADMAPGAAVTVALATPGGRWGAEEEKELFDGGEAVYEDADEAGMSGDDREKEMAALGEGAERVRRLAEDRKRLDDSRSDLPGYFGGDDDAPEMKRKRAVHLVREYAHRAKEPSGVRDDFAEVLYWHPLLVTDEKGEARFEFDTPDSVTTFRVAVDAHDGRGALGAASAEFSNRVPLFAEPKFPLALSAGDEIDLPVVVANDSASGMAVSSRVRPDGKLLALRGGSGAALVNVASGARGRMNVPLVALDGRGAATLDVEVAGGVQFTDRSRRTIEVHPRGFPVTMNRSGLLEKKDAATFVLPDRLNRVTMRGGVRIYPSTLATLVDGLDSMLEEPHGCFEQVSSSNYPNVLVLNYLEEQNAASPAVAARARDLLSKGYAMLTGYECSKRGFEWFGKDPGHEGLTAYGVMEFADMAKVHPGVDAKMVSRTRDWLLARRDGDGGFRRMDEGYDGFARAPQPVHDAYVAWSLSEADTATDLTAELARGERDVAASKEPYVVALRANTALNRGHASAQTALAKLVGLQRQDGGFDAAGTSITSSTGKNLEVETTALAALAFSKSPKHLANAETAVRFLLASRQGGRFGATQATILALRALTSHAKAAGRVTSDHEITVTVNGTAVGSRSVRAGDAGVVEIGDEVLDALVPGENRIDLVTTGAEGLPWALAMDFTTTLPANDPECAVTIETRLLSAEAAEGASVGAEVVVRNRTSEPQAMTLARFGVPGGLEPRAERLEELKKAGTFDFFEIRPREVVLYWRGLRAGEEKRVAFDLVASVPGRYEGPASSAYLYYGDDRKTWAAPLRVSVR